VSSGALGHFNNSVLYLGVDDTEGRLAKLASAVKTQLATDGFEVVGIDRGYIPHITVAKISQARNYFLREALSVEVIQEFMNLNQDSCEEVPVECLQLCRMGKRNNGQYYEVVFELPLKS